MNARGEELWKWSKNWDRLVRFCGYIENGSDTVVRLSQDDATRDWLFTVGNQTFYGRTPAAALEEAVKTLGEPE